MFFPFDPYLLQRSSRFLDPAASYVRWRKGGAGRRAGGAVAAASESDLEDSDEEEEEEEAEVSVKPVSVRPCSHTATGPAADDVTRRHLITLLSNTNVGHMS